MKTPIAITGVGAIAPRACNAQQLWETALVGACGAEPIPQEWRDYFAPNSLFWSPLQPQQYQVLENGLTPVEQRQLDISQSLALCATHEALNDAGLETTCVNEKKCIFSIPSIDPTRLGVFVGTGVGGISSLLQNHLAHISPAIPNSALSTSKRFNPFVVPMIMPNALSGQIGIRFGARGANHTVSGACSASTIALCLATDAISRGELDCAIVGGSEFLDESTGALFRGFDIARVLTTAETRPCAKPFTNNRSGFLFSNGASGILILESRQHAQNRGARILAQILAAAQSFDAYNIMASNPEGAGARRIITDLLQRADVSAQDIGHINTHGTGTQEGDRIEAALIEELFPHTPPLTASKAVFGHTLGASGALEAILTVLALQTKTCPPIPCDEEPSRNIGISSTTQHIKSPLAISHSFAFGGHNAGLLLAR